MKQKQSKKKMFESICHTIIFCDEYILYAVHTTQLKYLYKYNFQQNKSNAVCETVTTMQLLIYKTTTLSRQTASSLSPFFS